MRWKLVVLLAFLFVAFAGAGPATAQTNGLATLNTDHVASGGNLMISGTGFKPGSKVMVRYGATGGGTEATASDTGAVNNHSFSVSGQFGMYRVHLLGVDPSGNPRLLSAVFSITCGSSCTSLPRTGRDLTGLVVLGLSLTAAGLVITQRTRIADYFGPRPLMFGGAVLMLGGALVLAGPAVAQTSTGALSGKVSNSGGTGLASMCVHALAPNGGFGSATTAADGTYTISNLADATYRVFAGDCTATPTYITSPGTNATVTGGATMSNVNVTLTQGGTLYGKASDAAAPATGVMGCLWGGATAEAMGCVVFTGTEGTFATDPMPAGQQVLAFVPNSSHAITYLGNANDGSAAAAKATITAGQATAANFALPQSGVVAGTVTDAGTGGSPTRDVCIYDRSSNVRTLASGFVTAGGPGQYSFKLGAGNHKLEFADCGGSQGTAYPTEFYDNKPDVNSADPITITADQSNQGKNAAMGTGTGATTTSTTASSGTTTSTTASSATTTSTTAQSGTTTSTPGASTTTTTAAGGAGSTGGATLSSTSVAPGGQLTVNGGGFGPGSTVNAFVFSDPVFLASATADSAGNVSLRVTLPANLTAGAHTIQLQGVDPAGATRVLSSTVVVASASVLGVTGGPMSTSTAIGLSLIGLGVVLVRLSGRRYRPRGLHIGY